MRWVVLFVCIGVSPFPEGHKEHIQLICIGITDRRIAEDLDRQSHQGQDHGLDGKRARREEARRHTAPLQVESAHRCHDSGFACEETLAVGAMGPGTHFPVRVQQSWRFRLVLWATSVRGFSTT